MCVVCIAMEAEAMAAENLTQGKCIQDEEGGAEH